jgi:hypothetical protein
MIPDPSHMQTRPPHIRHLPPLDALAAPHSSVLLSFTHLPFSDEQASLQLITVDSELRLRLLSLHVARLTNLINPPTANWCDRQQLPSTGPAVHERRIRTRAITHYILPHTSYGADSLTSSSFRRIYPPCIPLHLVSLRISLQRPLHYKSRPPSPQTLRHSKATAKLASIYPPFETADPGSCHPYDL